jgi:putative oxidoreductase
MMQGVVSFAGRVLLAAVFAVAVILTDIVNFSTTAQAMQQQGIPAPRVALVATIILLSLGIVSLVLGCLARWGAAMLAVFLAVSAYYFHDFWSIQDTALAQDQLAHFLKNLSLFGAMLFVIANGAGAWSIDACCTRRLSGSP